MDQNNTQATGRCPECGLPLETHDGKFCPSCGKDLQSVQPVQPAQNQSYDQGQQNIYQQGGDQGQQNTYQQGADQGYQQNASQQQYQQGAGQGYQQNASQQQYQQGAGQGYQQNTNQQQYNQGGTYQQQGFNGQRDPNMVYPEQCKVGPGVSALINLFIVGLAQMINGQGAKGGIMLGAQVVFACLGVWFVTLPLMVVSIIDAYMCSKKLQSGAADW